MPADPFNESTSRQPLSYVLFGVAAGGLLLGAAGVIIASPATAILGAVLVLLVLGLFRVGGTAAD
ncbi:MAG TPA: hypothetical protein VN673_04480 [Clostridia bacterium]|nr:hypothetical protein [Clostridia bacterium]